MKAYVIYKPGGPEQFILEEKPIPTWKAGWVITARIAESLSKSLKEITSYENF